LRSDNGGCSDALCTQAIIHDHNRVIRTSHYLRLEHRRHAHLIPLSINILTLSSVTRNGVAGLKLTINSATYSI
jgi:hypothetical protein